MSRKNLVALETWLCTMLDSAWLSAPPMVVFISWTSAGGASSVNSSQHYLETFVPHWHHRMDTCREIYTYPGSLASSRGNAGSASDYRRQQSRLASQGHTTQDVGGEDFCGVSFGSMGHLAALRSDGSVLAFLLRPCGSSPGDPESPMVPTCLAQLPVAAQISTGAAQPFGGGGFECISPASSLCALAGKAVIHDEITTVARSTFQQDRQNQAHPGPGVQRLTIKTRPYYVTQFSITGSHPYLACSQSTGDAMCFKLPGDTRVLGCTQMASTVGEGVMQQLLRAKKPSSLVPEARQQLFRFHTSQIVYITSFPASGELLTVDLSGCIAIWPAPWSVQPGLAWMEPTRVMQFKRSMLVPQLGADLGLPVGAVILNPLHVNVPFRISVPHVAALFVLNGTLTFRSRHMQGILECCSPCGW